MKKRRRIVVVGGSAAGLKEAAKARRIIDNDTEVIILQNKMKGRMKGISCAKVHRTMTSGDSPFFIDVRQPAEFEQMRLGISETLMPFGALRKRLHELP